jgi:hypothetical protein
LRYLRAQGFDATGERIDHGATLRLRPRGAALGRDICVSVEALELAAEARQLAALAEVVAIQSLR